MLREAAPALSASISAMTGPTRSAPRCNAWGAYVGAIVEGRETEANITPLRPEPLKWGTTASSTHLLKLGQQAAEASQKNSSAH